MACSLNRPLTRSFPRIHFPLATLSPIVPVDRVQHEINDVAEITTACFQRGSQMINCDPMEGKYSASLQSRLMASPISLMDCHSGLRVTLPRRRRF
jgi:hypothetical protein